MLKTGLIHLWPHILSSKKRVYGVKDELIQFSTYFKARLLVFSIRSGRSTTLRRYAWFCNTFSPSQFYVRFLLWWAIQIIPGWGLLPSFQQGLVLFHSGLFTIQGILKNTLVIWRLVKVGDLDAIWDGLCWITTPSLQKIKTPGASPLA